MVAAFLTAIFFALSAVFANRSIRAVGAARANLGRLIFAALCLGAYAHLAGNGLRGAGRDWLLLSGVIGMGLGDLALFMALPLLGSRLTVLMTQCLAAPIAMLAERLWLGTRLGPAQLLWSFVILAGVAFALLPSRADPPRVQVKPIGFLFGFLSRAAKVSVLSSAVKRMRSPSSRANRSTASRPPTSASWAASPLPSSGLHCERCWRKNKILRQWANRPHGRPVLAPISGSRSTPSAAP